MSNGIHVIIQSKLPVIITLDHSLLARILVPVELQSGDNIELQDGFTLLL